MHVTHRTAAQLAFDPQMIGRRHALDARLFGADLVVSIDGNRLDDTDRRQARAAATGLATRRTHGWVAECCNTFWPGGREVCGIWPKPCRGLVAAAPMLPPRPQR